MDMLRRATPPRPSPAMQGRERSGFAPPPACRGRLGGGKAFDLAIKSDPTPTLPCKQGRGLYAHFSGFRVAVPTWQHRDPQRIPS